MNKKYFKTLFGALPNIGERFQKHVFLFQKMVGISVLNKKNTEMFNVDVKNVVEKKKKEKNNQKQGHQTTLCCYC